MNARSNAIDVIHQFGMIVPSLDVQVPPLMIFGLFIFFYYQINVGTSCPGCNGWEYICFVDTPQTIRVAHEKCYMFSSIKILNGCLVYDDGIDIQMPSASITKSCSLGWYLPPQLALERYPTTLILSINLCYIYSHVHSTPPTWVWMQLT